MTEIVVHVDEYRDQAGAPSVACYIDSPYAVARLISRLEVSDLPDLQPPPGVVQQLGTALAERIRANDSIKDVLDIVLSQPRQAPSLPIQFLVTDTFAHTLSWEALMGGAEFLALDERWPIARVARGAVSDGTQRRPFPEVLRVMCVLSAAGVPARDEWEAFHAAVVEARQEGLQVHVTLVASEKPEVLDPATALGDPMLEVVPVPGPTAPQSLLDLVEARQPHVLHVFCHGNVKDEVRLLELATVNDADQFRAVGTVQSSVVVRPEELGLAAKRAGTWCVVLNACRGAEAGSESLTHAEEVVAQGIPVAVGMRRPIDVGDATAFTRKWYPEVFEALREVQGLGPGEHLLSWSDMLGAARRHLRDIHGGDARVDDTWTLPVLYKSPGGFAVVVPVPGVSEEAERAGLTENAVLDGLVAVMPTGAEATALAQAFGVGP